MARKSTRKTKSPTAVKPRTSTVQNSASPRFPLVGVGASAGGVEALLEFFGALKPDSGMAFAVVMHLDPEHKSAFPEILSKVTRMPVAEAKDGVPVKPNHVYLLPPNAEMLLKHGVLKLAPRSPARPPMPIDTFLNSLADDLQYQSVGVVLSGTGSDGTRGLRAVKGSGGVTFAQDHTAAYSGMPRSAIQAGCVDFVLPPKAIAAELAHIHLHGYLKNPANDEAIPDTPDANEIPTILRILTRSSGVDFAQYKVATLQRRIQRRMIARRLSTLTEYVQFLRSDQQEVQALFEEMLIQVTSFFRDPEAYEALAKTAFPRMIDNRSPQAPIRVWVPGCSSGEEVYTLAIMLLEFLDENPNSKPIKLFGTDVNEKALAKARAGIYVDTITSDVSPQRLRRFFTKTDGSYQVKKQLRDLCVFARQDLTRDPPFSQLDLVSCRNLLIYLGPTLQNHVMPTIHYALKPSSFLFLGMSETVGSFTDLFEVVDKKHKIYRATEVPSRLKFEYRPDRHNHGHLSVEPSEARAPGATDVQREADRIVLTRYAPAGVVVDENLQVLQFRGQTGLCLEQPPGAPTLDLLQMLREGLLSDLRNAVERARTQNLPVRVEKIPVKTNHHFKDFNLEVLPLNAPASGNRYFIILFEDAEIFPPVAETTSETPERERATRREEIETARARAATGLKQELAATRAYLQSVIEDKEAANEELKAANEEIVSSNEELQSTNEELETAKEELQATNEELTTVNDELQSQIAVVSQLSDDLTNLIDSVNLPTVVVDNDLRLRRLTPQAQRVLNLHPTDIGRPISDFKLNLNVVNLEGLLHEVLDTFTPRHLEVTGQGGIWYKLSIHPYRRDAGKIDGAVLTLTDINTLKHREKEIEQSYEFTRSIVSTVREPLVVLDAKLQVQFANAAFYATFQTSERETEKAPIHLLGNRQWDIPRLRGLLNDVLSSGKVFENFEVRHTFPMIGERTMLLNARSVSWNRAENQQLILLAIEDVTERKHLEKQVLEIADQEQRRIGQELHDNIGQELTGLTMMADALASRLEKQCPSETELSTKIHNGMSRVHEHVRTLSRGLIPVQMNPTELPLALEELAIRTTEQAPCECRFEGDEQALAENASQATHMYRIAQEAVSNAMRHADPKTIAIKLCRDVDGLTLTVRDDGHGFDLPALTRAGNGIRIMQYRAGLIGANLHIASAPSNGTIVTCTLPMK